jgi:hypothetical protein
MSSSLCDVFHKYFEMIPVTTASLKEEVYCDIGFIAWKRVLSRRNAALMNWKKTNSTTASSIF